MNTLYKYRGFFLIVFAIMVPLVIFSYVDIAVLVERIGIHNSYLVLFFVALFAGASSLTSSSYYATIVTLALAGLDPLTLALFGGVGLTVSDGLFYWFGTLGRSRVSGKLARWLDVWAKKLARYPRFAVQILVYIYTGFTPLPADILMIALSFSKFPYRSFVIPCLVGNITFILVLIAGVRFGTSFLSGLY